MIAIQPLQLGAANALGVLTTIGAVLVENRQVSSKDEVFAGEVVQTKANSKAILSSPGKTISIAQNSTVRFAMDAVELQSGAVLVASTGAVVRVGNALITADTSRHSKFLACKVNGAVQVLALEGSVSVNDGQETTQVPATKGVGIGSGGDHLSWLLNDDIGTLIVVAAAITAGVTLGIVNSENAKPASPAGP
jgi:hypothetical protein